MKPILKYSGGKSKELPLLIPHIPLYEWRYIEPFFGGGAMFFYLELEREIINDINSNLMGFYSAVQQNYIELTEELAQLENLYNANRIEYEYQKKQHP